MASRTPLCQPCFSHGKIKPGSTWCKQCEDYFCAECTDNHTPGHQLADLNKIPENFKALVSLSKSCEKHPKSTVGYFCVDHDQVCCYDCIEQTHNSCSHTMSLRSASNGIVMSEIFSDCNKDLDSLIDTLAKILENRRTNINEIKTKGEDIKRRIHHAKKEFIIHLNTLEKMLIDEVETIVAKQTNNMRTEVAEVGKRATVLNEHKCEIECVVQYGSEEHIFLSVHKIKENLLEIETKTKTMLQDLKNVDMEFLESVPSLGSLDVKESPCTITHDSPKKIQAQIPFVSREINTLTFEKTINIGKSITALAFTKDNKLLCCNKSMHEVVVYGENCKLIKTLKTNMPPWDITVIPNRPRAAVTFFSNNIQFIDTTNFTLGTTIDVGCSVFGITSKTNEIILGGSGKILILDADGNHVRNITTPGGQINYIHTGIDNTFLCSKGREIFCVKTDGEVLYTFAIPGESKFYALKTDRRGNVFIVAYSNRQIYKVLPDGSAGRVILDKDSNIYFPQALSFNRLYTKLYISEYQSGVISVYNCG